MPSLQRAFLEPGLLLNPRKTQLLGTESTVAAGRKLKWEAVHLFRPRCIYARPCDILACPRLLTVSWHRQFAAVCIWRLCLVVASVAGDSTCDDHVLVHPCRPSQRDCCHFAPSTASSPLRRRLLYLLLHHNPSYNWQFACQFRLWSYLGHLMRRPDEHPTRVIFTSLQGLQRPQGGFVNSPRAWLRRHVNLAYPGAPDQTRRCC